MKKILKIVNKTIYTVICFSVMFAVLMIGNSVTGSAMGEIQTYKPSENVYASLYIDYIGQKVKLSEVYYLTVRAGYRSDDETGGKNVRVAFYATELSESSSLGFEMARRYLPIAAYRYTGGEEVYYNPRSSYHPFSHENYIQDRLFYLYDHDSEDFKKVTNPENTDAYGESARVRRFSVDLRRLVTVETVSKGVFNLAVTLGHDQDDVEEESNRISIYFATDGEYIAFSKVSYEDAESILTGEPVKPTAPSEPSDNPSKEPPEETASFWETISDFFDGCDDDENMDDY